jgi:hypothetical protein
MRAAFGYEGCPIVLVPKARTRTIEPVRKARKGRRTSETEVASWAPPRPRRSHPHRTERK